MKLLTKALRKTLPPLYSSDSVKDPTVHAKFFDPCSSWTWYVIEGGEIDGEYRFFGLVDGLEAELGYFTLAELESYRGPYGLSIERDLFFTPRPLSEIRAKVERKADQWQAIDDAEESEQSQQYATEQTHFDPRGPRD